MGRVDTERREPSASRRREAVASERREPSARDAPGAPRPRATQAERRARSQRRLLEAAVRLIAEQGLSRTTLAQIGERAGYSRGLVTERFGSKAGLVEALTREIQERFAFDRLLPALQGQSGRPALLAAVDTYLDTLERGELAGRAFYALLAESLGPMPEIRRYFAGADRAFRATVERWLADGVAAGEVRRDVDVRAFAGFVVGALRGIALQRFVDPEGIDLGALRKEFASALGHSLERRGG